MIAFWSYEPTGLYNNSRDKKPTFLLVEYLSKFKINCYISMILTDSFAIPMVSIEDIT